MVKYDNFFLKLGNPKDRNRVESVTQFKKQRNFARKHDIWERGIEKLFHTSERLLFHIISTDMYKKLTKRILGCHYLLLS